MIFISLTVWTLYNETDELELIIYNFIKQNKICFIGYNSNKFY